MADKRIIDLTLRTDFDETCNMPTRDGIQTWRVTGAQLLTFLKAELKAAGGSIPVGAVIGIQANLTGAYAIPGTGTVDDNGYMLCDGSSIPGGNSVSGSVPNLTDSRFLMGSTTAGTTGGVNTSSATSGGAASFNKTVMNSNQTAHSHAATNMRAAIDFFNTGNTVRARITTNSVAYTNNVEVDANLGTASSAGSNSSGPIITGSTDTTSVSWSSTTVNTTFTQPVVDENRPVFISTVYLMRVN
jgi:hypothetical protein